MSVTPWLPTVRKIKDGEFVEQATVNVPIDQLAQREQHLYEKFDELLGKSVLISFGQPIHPRTTLAPGELNVVYFNSDDAGIGLARGTTGFSSSGSSSYFRPNNSNYLFGIVKTVYTQTHTADVYIEGLCDLGVDLDHSSLGLIQQQPDGTPELFTVGPYYLSHKSPGKITNDPAGIPVYVGYAINKRQFLLHTSADEFSQFFINYRYHILDRVAGRPINTGGVWSIGNVDTTRLGWIPASIDTPGKPAGAVFYYNIPSITALTADTGLAHYTKPGTSEVVYFERDEAYELYKLLPPIPANFVQLYIDGTLMRYKDDSDTAGIYSINDYGLWWHSAAEGTQPWANNYPSNQSPQGWSDIISPTVTRKRIFISFSKFNPALRTQLVSSLRTFNTATNNSANFIKFYSADNVSQEAHTGDLLVDLDPKFTYKGYNDNTSFAYPNTVVSTYTADRAIAGIAYSKPAGVFQAALTPVVAKITAGPGIVISPVEGTPGVYKIGNDYSAMTSGMIDSVEPINSRLEFIGLSSFIKLPPPSATPYGLIGKIILPKGYARNTDLRIVFHLFGDSTVASGITSRSVAFQFDYSSVSAANGATPTSHTLVDARSYPATPAYAEFTLGDAATAYTANTSLKITHTNLTIPAAFIGEDTVVNFRIYRTALRGLTGNNYEGNVGLLGIYWDLLAV